LQQEGIMADPAAPPGSPPQAAHDEPFYHNPVLTRSHEPSRATGGPWLVVIPLAVVLIAGAAFWVYVQGHPGGPVVNHSVAAESTTSG
jgi:hypothetical protein